MTLSTVIGIESISTAAFELAQALISYTKLVASLCKILRNLKGISEDDLFVLGLLTDPLDLSAFPGADRCVRESLDYGTTVASLIESYREAYARLAHLSHSSNLIGYISCHQRSEAIRLSKAMHSIFGSGGWISEKDEFLRWRNTSKSSLLLLSGSRGAGKSTTCSMIIDNLESDHRVEKSLAYYFADGRFKSSNTVFNVLVTIATRLLSGKTGRESRYSLETLLNDLDTTEGRLSQTQIREFFLRIIHTLGRKETFYLILDGLDDLEECETINHFLQEVVSMVRTLNLWHPMKVLISTRPNSLFRVDIQDFTQIDIDGEISAHNEVALNAIKNRYSRGWIEESISRVPERERYLVLQVLRWVIYATRPLYLHELLDAISLQLGKKVVDKDIQSICGQLLRISKSGIVSLVHLGLLDFLESLTSENDILGWAAASQTSNEMIAHTCLQILDTSIEITPMSEISPPKPHSLQGYAIRYWKCHYKLAERPSSHLPGMVHEIWGKLYRFQYPSVVNNEETLQGVELAIQSFSKSALQEINAGLPIRGKLLQHGMDISNSESSVEAIRCEENIPPIQNRISDPLKRSNEVLREGAQSGLVELVKLELEIGARPNSMDHRGYTPLHYAALHGDLYGLELLIDYGANIQASSHSGDTPLSCAVANRKISAVEMLLERVGNTPCTNSTGLLTSPVRHSYQRLCLIVSVVKACLDCGAVKSEYVFSKLPENDEDDEVWPSIHVKGETLSLAEISDQDMQSFSATLSTDGLPSEQRTVVKWFPGLNMYKALGIAAKSGMEDVAKLLIAAGNNIKFLEKHIYLNKLISRMNVGDVAG